MNGDFGVQNETDRASDRVLVVLVRHAEAGTPEAFARHRPQRTDSERPLTAGGREQAQWLAESLAAMGPRPVRIFSSTYKRALQTAEPLARSAGLSVETDLPDDVVAVDPDVAQPKPFDPPLHPERLRRTLLAVAAQTPKLRLDAGSGGSLRFRHGLFVFGHEPDLSTVLEAWLCEARRAARGVLALDKGTAAIVELSLSPRASQTRDCSRVGARLVAMVPLALTEALVEKIDA